MCYILCLIVFLYFFISLMAIKIKTESVQLSFLCVFAFSLVLQEGYYSFTNGPFWFFCNCSVNQMI
jgi:hypothetical protein